MKIRGFYLVPILAVTAMLWAPVAQGQAGGATDEQVSAGLVVQFPGAGDFDVYDIGLGVEFQYRRWYGLGGLGLSLGLEQWSTESRTRNWAALRQDEPARLSGDLNLVPIGVSGLGRWPIREGLQLRGEAGLRYVWVDPDMTLQRAEWDRPESVRIKDGWVVLAGVGMEKLLTDTLMFTADLRYQHDLVRADARVPSAKLMSNHLRSFGIKLGLQLWF